MNPDMTKVGLVLMGASDAPVYTPGPGVYEHVPMWNYHAWDAASNTRLTRLRRSAAHLRAYLDEPIVDRAHLAIGRAAHSAILEPEDFATRYGCGTVLSDDRRSKAGKEEWATLEAKFGEGHVFKLDDYAALLAMRDAVFAHSKARKLLEGRGPVELSVVWRDRDSELLCKARFDKHSPLFAGGAIVDLKTTTDASEGAFARSINEHGYHRQGARYLEGAEASGLDARHFVNVAIEKSAPYAVAVYELDEPSILRGANQLKRLKARYAECVVSGVWPAYSANIVPIGLPEWAAKQIDQETEAYA